MAAVPVGKVCNKTLFILLSPILKDLLVVVSLRFAQVCILLRDSFSVSFRTVLYLSLGLFSSVTNLRRTHIYPSVKTTLAIYPQTISIQCRTGQSRNLCREIQGYYYEYYWPTPSTRKKSVRDCPVLRHVDLSFAYYHFLPLM